MKPSIQELGRILYSPSQYVIPVFQRNYRWDRAQWEKLWSSIIELRGPTKTGKHFMGFLVFVPGLAQPGQHTQFHVIDGQQRLTTSSILLLALRNVARSIGLDDLAEEVDETYLIHARKKGDERFRLLPKAKDKKNYVAIVTSTGDPSGRMADALGFFEERFQEAAEADPDNLRALLDVVSQRLEFMCATLEAENAYNIFKSLNSTGVPLGPSDLIRNFVFMHVKPDDQDEFDADRWARLESMFTTQEGRLDEDALAGFFRDVLMMEGRYVQPKEIFSTFESRYEATNFVPNKLADDLLALSGYYAVIRRKRADASAEVTEALDRLNDLESSTTFPLLLSLFKRRAEGALDSSELARSIRMLCGFILRRFVCSESSRGYGQMFVRAIDLAAEDPVGALENYLLQRGWPDRVRFETAFSSFPLYQRGYNRIILQTIERARGHKEQAALEAAQIEHIMPQTLNAGWLSDLGPEAGRIHAEWLHRPGNLTLSAYNQELWNHPFPVKRQAYLDSNVGITRELATHISWGEREIDARGRAFAREAAAIWIGPEEPYVRPGESAAPDGDAATEVGGSSRLRFWSGLLEFLAEEYPDLASFNSRASTAIRLRSGIRYVGFELRHGLRPACVAIDVYFWRSASFSVWSALEASPGRANELIEGEWEFGRMDDDKYRWMHVESLLPSGDESEWPAAYAWIGRKLTLLYQSFVPLLREEMTMHQGG